MSETRNYTHISTLGIEVLELLSQGKTQREVAEQFGFADKYVVKEFVKRHNRQLKRAAAGIMSRPKGRPRKDVGPMDADRMKDYEIKRLRMENELLRDFLRAAGRR